MKTLLPLLRMMYWSVRKDWRVLPHLATVVVSALVTLVVLRVRGWATDKTVAIGLVEHLGDIIAAEPIARLARRQYPQARVLWVVRKPYAQLPRAFTAVDGVVGVVCLTEWLLLRAAGLGQPAWDLHINQRYCPRCQIPVLKNGPPGMLNPENYYASGNLLAVQCLSAGLPVLDNGPSLAVDTDAAHAIDLLGLPPRFIVIHCGSNEAIRNWPEARWDELLGSLLLDPSLTAVEIGLVPMVIMRDAEGRRNLCGKLPILQTVELIRRAALFIGVDSGPAHLANAVCTSGVILLGTYKGLASYMPFSGRYQRGEGADILRADGPMDALAVAPVLAAARRRLSMLSE